MSAPKLLEVHDVHAVYGRKIRAIKGVTLEVRAGEIVTLIGSNGAGKTTLLKTIAGLMPPDQGRIIFEGSSLGGRPAHAVARLGIALVPEGRRLFPRLSVWENLEMGAYSREDSLAGDFARILELFPIIGKRRKQLAGTLSGGEQQMVAMARALMMRPRLLMLDEPSMGLAPVIVEKIFEVIRRVNAEGVTVFLVEQNAKMALETASRGYVLETGEITLEDSSASLLGNPAVHKAYLGL